VLQIERSTMMHLASQRSPTMSEYNRRVSDWIKLKCGDRVLDVRDPRHDGRVVAVQNGVVAVVKWDNGWKSEHSISNLCKL
jgi:hypothetical protein